jgi:hypothetical protein
MELLCLDDDDDDDVDDDDVLRENFKHNLAVWDEISSIILNNRLII